MTIVKILLYVALVIGVVGFIIAITCLILAGFGSSMNSKYIEMPIGQTPAGGNRYLAVDSKGNIYIFNSTCSRIQKYSSAGCFLCGWFVKCAFPKLVLDKQENLHVVVNNISRFVFDSNGDPLPFSANSSMEYTRALMPGKIVGNDGFEYELVTGLFKSSVLRYNRFGIPTIVVQEPWYFFLRWPSPGGELMFFSALLLFIISRFRKSNVTGDVH